MYNLDVFSTIKDRTQSKDSESLSENLDFLKKTVIIQ